MPFVEQDDGILPTLPIYFKHESGTTSIQKQNMHLAVSPHKAKNCFGTFLSHYSFMELKALLVFTVIFELLA